VFKDVRGSVAIDSLDAGGTTMSRDFTQVDCLWTGVGPAVVTDTKAGYNGTLFIDTEFNQSGGSIVADFGIQTLHAWNSEITGTASVGNVFYGSFVNSIMGQFDKRLTYVFDVPQHLIDEPAMPHQQVLSR
jgi:hypothetical protein